MAKKVETKKTPTEKATRKPRVRPPQLNVTLTAEWRDRIPELQAKLAKAAGLGRVDVPDVVMAGFDLLNQWCELRLASGARDGEVAALKEPEVAEERHEKRGRPRKVPTGD